jgi:hypothetical protein
MPRGLLFILDDGGLEPESLDSLRFDKRILDLEAEGRCVVPRIKWMH